MHELEITDVHQKPLIVFFMKPTHIWRLQLVKEIIKVHFAIYETIP